MPAPAPAPVPARPLRALPGARRALLRAVRRAERAAGEAAIEAALVAGAVVRAAARAAARAGALADVRAALDAVRLHHARCDGAVTEAREAAAASHDLWLAGGEDADAAPLVSAAHAAHHRAVQAWRAAEAGVESVADLAAVAGGRP